MSSIRLIFLVILSLGGCTSSADQQVFDERPYLQVLGIAQDAGYPQSGCTKACCQQVWQGAQSPKRVSCLGLIDPVTHSAWMFDATPDFKEQLHALRNEGQLNLAGILLSHAHIGHYTGLMELGREVMGAENVPVYVMPRMKQFIEKNGPWSQLVDLENIKLLSLKADSTLRLNIGLQVQPIVVPHRDEFSETVGFLITGPGSKALYIPDIDKWSKWNKDIVGLIKEVDVAFLDGTFYQDGEIPGRDMSLIPHPFVEESMQLFDELSEKDKSKIYFIHLNHTNPLLRNDSRETEAVERAGYGVAREGQRIYL